MQHFVRQKSTLSSRYKSKSMPTTRNMHALAYLPLIIRLNLITFRAGVELMIPVLSELNKDAVSRFQLLRCWVFLF